VVEVNRAVALGRAYGPAAGLELIDQVAEWESLRGYHLVPAVRGDLYLRLGRNDEAALEFERAAGLTSNERERGLLHRRAVIARSGGAAIG
jgi:predicted RNA polymerase sigma factor